MYRIAVHSLMTPTEPVSGIVLAAVLTWSHGDAFISKKYRRFGCPPRVLATGNLPPVSSAGVSQMFSSTHSRQRRTRLARLEERSRCHYFGRGRTGWLGLAAIIQKSWTRAGCFRQLVRGPARMPVTMPQQSILKRSIAVPERWLRNAAANTGRRLFPSGGDSNRN